MLEFRLFPLLAETGVIEVLSSALFVDADRLQWSGVGAGDADLLPGRRDSQLRDPGEGFLVGDLRPIGLPIGEAGLLRPFAANAVIVESPSSPDTASRHDLADFARMVPLWNCCKRNLSRSRGLSASSSGSQPPPLP